MSEKAVAGKAPEAFRTISEAAEDLGLPQHVLRFWETRFPEVKPLKRAGGRRFYRPEDVDLLRAVKALLYGQGYTIKGVQRLLRERGPRAVAGLAPVAPATLPPPDSLPAEVVAAPEEPAPSASPPTDALAPLRAALDEIIACERLLARARDGG